MIDDLGGSDHVGELAARAARARGRRVLPVQALLRDLSRTRRTSSRSGGSTSRSSCCARSRSRRAKARSPERTAARAHRPPGQGRDDAGAGRERVHPRQTGAGAHGEGHGHRARPPPPDVHTGAFLEVVPRPRRQGPAGRRAGTVAIFPTCLVEYQEPAIGQALVGVYEHNGFACELPEGQVCCGMPWLDAGDTEKFREHAQKNVDALLPAVEAGMSIVVAQPTCAYTLKDEVPAFLGTDAARKVAAHTFEASEFLVNEHRKETLDTDFRGQTYESIVWHAACHYRAQQMGPKSSLLMQLTGAKVQMVERCAAIDGTWGLRAENIEMAKKRRQTADGTRARVGSRAGRRRLPAREHRDPRRRRQAAGAPVAGPGPGVRHGVPRTNSEEDPVRKLQLSDIKDTQGVRERARRVPPPHHRAEEATARPAGHDHDDRVREPPTPCASRCRRWRARSACRPTRRSSTRSRRTTR